MRYVYASLYSLATVIVSYPVFIACRMVCRWVYEALIEYFPSVFNDYSPVLEVEEYYRSMNTVSYIATGLALLISTAVITRLDNGRDEYMIEKTEGFYRLPKGMRIYYATYALPDLVASAISVALLCATVIPSYLINSERASGIETVLVSFRETHIGVIFGELPYPAAAFIIFAAVYLFKLSAGIGALKKWRASWLAYN